jgi:hypothetical protein
MAETETVCPASSSSRISSSCAGDVIAPASSASAPSEPRGPRGVNSATVRGVIGWAASGMRRGTADSDTSDPGAADASVQGESTCATGGLGMATDRGVRSSAAEMSPATSQGGQDGPATVNANRNSRSSSEASGCTARRNDRATRGGQPAREGNLRRAEWFDRLMSLAADPERSPHLSDPLGRVKQTAVRSPGPGGIPRRESVRRGPTRRRSRRGPRPPEAACHEV